MIKNFLRRQLLKQRDLILHESRHIKNFMLLLMKHQNTGLIWTKDEKKELRAHLKHLTLYVPALIIFILPCGALLLPVLAEILDRRKEGRSS